MMERRPGKISGRNFLRLNAGILVLSLLSSFAFQSGEVSLNCLSEKEEKCVFEQGRAGVVLLSADERLNMVRAKIWQKTLIFKKLDQEGRLWMSFVPVALDQAPGIYPLSVQFITQAGSKEELIKLVYVHSRSYPVERLTLATEMVEFPPEIVKQINQDNQVLLSGMRELSPVCFWEGAFIPPVPGEVTSGFGARRILNEVPKSPHKGTDFKADLGQEVRAPNNGQVSLVYQGYLTGNSLIIDHGCGLFSIYYHLSEILVRPGDLVKKGEVIARVGASGRVSGPHLHFGLRLNNVYIDPLSVMELSQRVEQRAFSSEKEAEKPKP